MRWGVVCDVVRKVMGRLKRAVRSGTQESQ